MVLSGRTQVPDNACSSIIKTPKDVNSLFSLNKAKLHKIFNSHSWQTINGRKIIVYRELIKLLKQLDIYPQLIANYELKVILSEGAQKENFNMFKTTQTHSKHESKLSLLSKQTSTEYITFEQFEKIISRNACKPRSV